MGAVDVAVTHGTRICEEFPQNLLCKAVRCVSCECINARRLVKVAMIME